MFSTSGGLNREGGLNKSEGFIRGWIIYEGGGGAEQREYSMCSITLSDFYSQMSLTYSLAPRFY